MKIQFGFTCFLASMLMMNGVQAQQLKNFPVKGRSAGKLSSSLDKHHQRGEQLLNDLEAQGSIDCLSPYQEQPKQDSIQETFETSYYTLEDDKEFLMGQPEVAMWSESMRKVSALQKISLLQTQELTRIRSCVSDPKSLERIDKLLSQHERLTDRAMSLIEKQQGRLERFVKRHPIAQELQEQAKELKGIERQQAKNPMQVQTTEMVLDKMASNLGMSKEEVARHVSQKLSEASNRIQEAQQMASESLKTEAYQRKTFKEKLVPGFNLSFNNSSPSTLDGIANLGYQLNPRIVMGIGLNHRLALGKGWDQIDIKRLGWGYRSFVDYDIWKSLFIEGAFERFNGAIVQDRLSTESDSNTWRESFLIGLGINQIIGQQGVFTTTVLYRLNNNNTQFPNRWIIRMGFNISKK